MEEYGRTWTFLALITIKTGTNMRYNRALGLFISLCPEPVISAFIIFKYGNFPSRLQLKHLLRHDTPLGIWSECHAEVERPTFGTQHFDVFLFVISPHLRLQRLL